MDIWLNSNRKIKILIITTGGTIAGKLNKNALSDSDYQSGVIEADELINSMEAKDEKAASLLNKVDLRIMSFSNINSDDITSKEWLELAKLIQKESSQNDKYDGIVITHGTDTMSDTAFFLSMTVRSDIPIILTGAMFPSDSINADGPGNLFGAIKCICDWDSFHGKNTDQCIYLYFDNELLDGRYVYKASSSLFCDNKERKAVFTFGEFEHEIGELRDFYHKYDLTSYKEKELPRVPVFYFYTDAEVDIINNYVNKAVPGCPNAMIIAGAGAGEYSLLWQAAIKRAHDLGIVIVRCSKIMGGESGDNKEFSKYTINAKSMPPEKAAILMRLWMAGKT